MKNCCRADFFFKNAKQARSFIWQVRVVLIRNISFWPKSSKKVILVEIALFGYSWICFLVQLIVGNCMYTYSMTGMHVIKLFTRAKRPLMQRRVIYEQLSYYMSTVHAVHEGGGGMRGVV